MMECVLRIITALTFGAAMRLTLVPDFPM
jgi:hypothetical protein